MGTGAGEGGVTGRARVRGEGAGCQAAHRGGEPPRAKVRRRGGGCFNTKDHKERQDGMYRNTKTGMPGGQWQVTAGDVEGFRGQRVENHEKDSAAELCVPYSRGRGRGRQRDRTTGHGNGARAMRTATGRGGASREARRPSIAPTATGPHHGARQWGRTTGPKAGWCKGRGALRAKFAGVMAVGRDVLIAPHG